MSTSIADLLVNISTDIASLEQGMAKASSIVAQTANNISRSFDQLESRIIGVVTSVQGVAAAVGVALSARAFEGFIGGAIEAQASLVDLATRMGATAAEFSAFVPAATLSGTALDDIASASDKFSKNLVDIQSGVGKAGSAFQALGFNAEDAARFLKDPAQGLLELAQHLDQFADSGTKAAAVTLLIGRGGPQELAFFKQLGEQTALVSTVTDEQAAAAHALVDQWHEMELQGTALKNSIAAGVTPALTGMLKAFNDAAAGPHGLGQAIKDFANDGSLGVWASNVVLWVAEVIDWLSRIPKWLDAVAAAGDVAVFAIKTGLDVFALQFGGSIEDVVNANNARLKAQADFGAKWAAANAQQTSDLVKNLEAQNAALKASQQIYQTFGLFHTTTVTTPNAPTAQLSFDTSKVKAGLDDLTNLTNQYIKALDDVVIAYAKGINQVQQQVIANEQADLERSYSQGLIDFQEYYTDKISLQNQANQKTEALLQAEVAANQATVDGIAASLAKLKATYDASGQSAAQFAAYQKAELEANTKLEAANKTLVTSEAALETAKIKDSQLTKTLVEDYTKANSLLFQSVQATQQQIDAQNLANQAIGLTAAQVQLLTAARAQDKLQQDIATGFVTSAEIPALQAEIDKRKELAGVLAKGEDLQKSIDLFKDMDQTAKSAFEDIFENGTKAFQDIGASIKKFLIDVLYQLTVKQWIINIGANVTGLSTGALGNALGNNQGSLLNLFSGNSGLGGLLGSAGSAVAGTGFNLGAATFTGAATDAAWGDALAEGAGTLASSFSTAALAMVPVVGWIAAAGVAIYSLIEASKTPAEVKGQLQVSSGTTGFEDNAYSTTKSGLNIGFNDANTQQFSGQVGLALDQLVSGAIDSFNQRFSKAQSDAFAAVLGTMTFQAFEGTFTTEDFLQKYGGQVLQQVVSAAFNILDPALGSVEAGFSGTADEVGTFTNTLLSIYDESKGFSDTFKANIVGALADSTQATADKVQAFLQIMLAFGNGLDPISLTLQGLSSTDIPAFIDALGGAATAVSAMTFLFDNFYTAGQKLTQATTVLNSDFASLGITQIPQTHQAFLDLLNSFDLTTDAGRQMYASVLQLAPLFVQVHGTADQAASAVTSVSNALSTAAQSAQDFFNTNFYSDAEKQAQQYAADTKQVADAQAALNITIPTTVAGFRALIEGIDQTTPAGQALYAALIVLAPAVYDLSGAATSAATSISAAADTINNIQYPDTTSAADKFVKSFTSKIEALAAGSTGDLGDKAAIELPLVQQQIDSINKQIAAAWAASGGEFNTTIETLQQEASGLQDFNDALSGQLAQFTIYKAQYGADIAQQLVDLQTWYKTEQGALHGNVDALAALTTIFNQKWASIIAGTSAGVTGTTDALDSLRAQILAYANSLVLGNLSPLSPQQQLAEAAQQFNDELAKAQGGDQGALGDITKFSDTYLNLARQNFASSSQYTDIFDQVRNALLALGKPPAPAAPPAGSAPIPTTIVTTNGAAVASSADVQQANQTLQELLATLSDLSRADRQAYLAANADAAAEISAAVAASGKKISDLLASVKK